MKICLILFAFFLHYLCLFYEKYIFPSNSCFHLLIALAWKYNGSIYIFLGFTLTFYHRLESALTFERFDWLFNRDWITKKEWEDKASFWSSWWTFKLLPKSTKPAVTCNGTVHLDKSPILWILSQIRIIIRNCIILCKIKHPCGLWREDCNAVLESEQLQQGIWDRQTVIAKIFPTTHHLYFYWSSLWILLEEKKLNSFLFILKIWLGMWRW